VIPSTALNQAILDHPSLKFKVKKTFLEENSDDEAPQQVEEPSDEDDDIDIEADKVNPNINFQKEPTVLNEQYFKL
jgi:hypothetical protein